MGGNVVRSSGRMAVVALCAALVGLGAGCPTRFSGSPTFSGGPRGCFDRCEREDMHMQAFVYMGEFATGCVCELRGAGGGSAAGREHTSGGEGVAAVAGVWQQMLAAEEAAAR